MEGAGSKIDILDPKRERLGDANTRSENKIYLKTQDQGDRLSSDTETNYRLFPRADFLLILNSYGGYNAILNDYRDHLQSIEDEVNSNETLPIDEWKRSRWMGFYLRLQEELDTGTCGYVPNPKGGFLGFW